MAAESPSLAAAAINSKMSPTRAFPESLYKRVMASMLGIIPVLRPDVKPVFTFGLYSA